MSLFSLQSNDSRNMSKQVFRRPRQFMNRQTRRFQRNMSQGFPWKKQGQRNKKTMTTKQNRINTANHTRQNERVTPALSIARSNKVVSDSVWAKKTAHVLDTKKIVWSIKGNKQNNRYRRHQPMSNMPFIKGKRMSLTTSQTLNNQWQLPKAQRKQQRMNQQEQKNERTLLKKRLALDKAKRKKDEKKIQHSLYRKKQQKFE